MFGPASRVWRAVLNGSLRTDASRISLGIGKIVDQRGFSTVCFAMSALAADRRHDPSRVQAAHA